MYYNPYMYPYRYPYDGTIPMYSYGNQPGYWAYPQDYGHPAWRPTHGQRNIQLKDYGPNPFVVDINKATNQNKTFRTALWTGDHLQLTLMSIKPGEDIGLERHPNLDQFLRVEQGQGFVQMGNRKNNLTFTRNVMDDSAIIIPAGTWHNLTNTGNTPLKLYSIYAPPNHPFGTVHTTKAEAIAAED
ncbi:Mannose-6-phosphate isomerase, cupin superfamily [Halobacillus alkaliphilus]|uniref:Mannose-6-phosphate isomerase, cupin superfamily n=1 Tax=Halobacillus alkaliphilus TaxID=396056 RepID=A0A1I2PL83_9BACI|nr:cupin domain-containing protein [Halobacillus alkaliphilus]SFG14757.1 Mannose-6-phosphate isomerase, cupin superfamily [Halobacillus alkaliphilus]